MRVPYPAGIILVGMTSALLSGNGFSQAAHTTSQIKRPLIYQIGNVVRIHAEGERPLLRALDALQQKYGWAVDYEDPRYPAVDADANTVTNPSLRHRRHPNVGNSAGNSAGNSGREIFAVQFEVGPTADSRPNEDSILTTVVNAYNQGDGKAQFELRRDNAKDSHFAVVGVGVRGPNGETAGQQPVLDLPVTLTTERRSVEQTIASICQKVSDVSKIPVTPSGIAESFPGRGEVAIGGTEVPARGLLSKTLASAGDHSASDSNLSWRLLYDAVTKSYELSLGGAGW